MYGHSELWSPGYVLLLTGPLDLGKKVLTAAAVERLKPPARGQLDIFDRGYPGLVLSVSYGGTKTFQVFHRFEGKLRRKTIGRWPATTLVEARRVWRDV